MLGRIAAAACFAALPLTHVPAAEVPAALADVLAEVFGGEVPDKVAPAELDGFYEVTRGQNIYYFSADGRYALRGDLYDLEQGRNLSEERRGQARLDVLGELGEESMIVFAPSPAKHRVTVFTDVDCGYCAQLHRQMADYNRLGIAVRYVAYPRAGIPSPTYDKMVSVVVLRRSAPGDGRCEVRPTGGRTHLRQPGERPVRGRTEDRRTGNPGHPARFR